MQTVNAEVADQTQHTSASDLGLHCLQRSFLWDATVFILINAPGALQFKSPKNDVLKTKYGQKYQNFNVLKSFNMAFCHLFPIKCGRGIYYSGGGYQN